MHSHKHINIYTHTSCTRACKFNSPIPTVDALGVRGVFVTVGKGVPEGITKDVSVLVVQSEVMSYTDDKPHTQS